MNTILLATGLALSLTAVPLHAATADGATTLDRVTTHAGARHVTRVACDTAMWPTQRQVARRIGTGSDGAAVVRGHIVASGRAACAQGYTHVLVTFQRTGSGEPTPTTRALRDN